MLPVQIGINLSDFVGFSPRYLYIYIYILYLYFDEITITERFTNTFFINDSLDTKKKVYERSGKYIWYFLIFQGKKCQVSPRSE